MKASLCLKLCLLDDNFVGLQAWEAIYAQKVDVRLLVCDNLFDSELYLHSFDL